MDNNMLSDILSDPQKLQGIISAASGILGGAQQSAPPMQNNPAPPVAPASNMQPPQSEQRQSNPQSNSRANQAPPRMASSMNNSSGSYDPSIDIMSRAMPVIAAISQSGQNAVPKEKLNLLTAIKPFIAGEISTEFDHAVKLVSVAKMAKAAMGQVGSFGLLGGKGNASNDGTVEL